MKLFYRGVNHNTQTTIIKTDIITNGNYRGSSCEIHSPVHANTNHSTNLIYRGVSY